MGLRNCQVTQYFFCYLVGNTRSYFGIDPLFSLTGVPTNMDIGFYWNGNEGIVFTGCKWLRWIDLVLSEYCKSWGFVLRSHITKALRYVRQNITANFPERTRLLLLSCHSRFDFQVLSTCCWYSKLNGSWISNANIRAPLNIYSSSTWINMLCSFESKLGDNILTAKQRIVVCCYRFVTDSCSCWTFKTNCHFPS